MIADLPILMYHSICADNEEAGSEFVVKRSVFRAQMALLAKWGYATPSPEGLLDGKAPRTSRDVLITFDDGYRDNYEQAYTVLQEFGFTALIFLVGDFSRRTNWWDAAKGIKDTPLMSPAEIVELQRGGIEFGAHTFGHRSLPGLGAGDLNIELTDAKLRIEQITQRPVHWFAYPYGDVNSAVKEAVRSAGYRAAVATNSGPLHAGADIFEMRRVPVSNDPSESSLRAKVSGRDKLYRWGRWRIKRTLGMHNRYQSELGYGQ